MIDLIIFKFYKNVFLAATARRILMKEGISSYITDGRAILTDYLISKTIGGVYLQVFEDDFERALQILQQDNEKNSLKVTHTIRNPKFSCTCPTCGSNHLVYDSTKIDGIIFTEINQFTCCYCGNKLNIE